MFGRFIAIKKANIAGPVEEKSSNIAGPVEAFRPLTFLILF